MTCEHCESLIDDYVDDALTANDRTDVDAHVAECKACRTLAADVAAIRRTARALDRHEPPAHAWTKLAAAVDAERSSWSFGAWMPLAIAATLLMLIGTSWVLLRQPSPSRPATQTAAAPAVSAADAELAHSVENELKLAEEHYQKAIAGLEQITHADSSSLDPQVAAVLQKNLDVIDHAIGESRAALHTQPTNEVAQQSLFEALRNKVALLQDTVALINEMRKGNPEGTARAVSGLNQ